MLNRGDNSIYTPGFLKTINEIIMILSARSGISNHKTNEGCYRILSALVPAHRDECYSGILNVPGSTQVVTVQSISILTHGKVL